MRNKTLTPFLITIALVIGAMLPATADELHDPAEWLSGTLPVLYVDTQDNEPITSRDYYLNGTYYLDATGFEDRYESIGSREEPLPLQIKGRGNTTWTQFDKKPYRIKLDKKAALLGMAKNKHFNLMSEPIGAVFLADKMGFELSNRLGLAWAPNMEPVELVLNGDYVGLYWVTEKIRIDKDRVDITEQADGETDPEAITGGWLMEIDNSNDANQIVRVDRNDGSPLRHTWHSPDSLSEEQLDYISNLVDTVDSLIFLPDKKNEAWLEYIDLDALVRFYIVNEMMDNCESFSGSCYYYKDRGDDAKITFGPVWDMGSCFSHWRIAFTDFIYCQLPSYAHQHWIGELAKYNSFQRKVREVWHDVKENNWDNLDDIIDNTMNSVVDAAAADKLRWPDYGFPSADARRRIYKSYLQLKCEWLDAIWSKPFTVYGDLNADESIDITDINILTNIILETQPFDRMADLDFNHEVDIDDLSICTNRILNK